MGSRFCIHIVALATGGFASMEFAAVPGSNSGFDKALCRGQGIIGPAFYYVWPLGRGNCIVIMTGWIYSWPPASGEQEQAGQHCKKWGGKTFHVSLYMVVREITWCQGKYFQLLLEQPNNKAANDTVT